jgi:hypothetical protein
MTTDDAPRTDTVSTGRMVFSWALVGIPLAYGLYEIVLSASKLFTG